MATVFPSSLDTFTTKVNGVDDVLAADTNNLQDAVTALQAKLGVNGSSNTSTIDYKVAQLLSQIGAMVGVGQTWQNMLASRVDDTSYQNTTGKPIMVNVSQDDISGNNRMYGYVSTNNSTWVLVETSMSSESTRGSVGFIVPNGHYYRVNTSTPIEAWAELR